MHSSISYHPVSRISNLDTEATSSDDIYTDNDDADYNDETTTDTTSTSSRMHPLEVEKEHENFKKPDPNDCEQISIFYVQYCIFFVMISICCSIPVIAGTAYQLFQLLNVYFVVLPFTIHILLILLICKLYLASISATYTNIYMTQEGSALYTPFRMPSPSISDIFCDRSKSVFISSYTTIFSLIDLLLLGYVYPKYVWTLMIELLFTEVDGTPSIDWLHFKSSFELYRRIGLLSAFCRCFIALQTLIFVAAKMSNCTSPQIIIQGTRCLQFSYMRHSMLRLSSILHWVVLILILANLCTIGLGISSIVVHFGPNAAVPQINSLDCDPLDETECWLPFPTFHMLQVDNTTDTGYRVHFQGHLLPPLKQRGYHQKKIQPKFLNQLDGFSTMGPILFYLPGLKEAHEAGILQLKGPNAINESITKESITFLIRVDTKELVPHSAEIDYLDLNNPLVMIFPAQPLYHNQHYAVAVINAIDLHGGRLPPSNGMNAIHKNLLENDNRLISANTSKSFLHASKELLSTHDTNRLNRYRDKVIPSLEHACSFWFNYSRDSLALQLLFDFHTISETSQLGPVRNVRDATMKAITATDWDWMHHVRTNNVIDFSCIAHNNSKTSQQVLARTVHAELDVPWFLKLNPDDKKSSVVPRSSVLIDFTKRSAEKMTLNKAKFIVHIPCSIQAFTVSSDNSTSGYDTNQVLRPIRAVVEFGHGLFGNRGEASDDFLIQMAHDEGYVIVAMDWRGMSTYDLLLIAKILISTPHLFESVRDNIIQGYACKYSLQHFTRHALLSLDWFSFKSHIDGKEHAVKTHNNEAPVYAFYGISQGGILGAGYTALSGTTGLIDRSIIGSGGTPFAMIMSRSRDFLMYDYLLKLDFYTNRHVRMLLALVQMAWDSVEGSGVLAPPISEPFPRLLLQAGLGDIIVPTSASEALSRALNASILINSPRQVYGLPVYSQSNAHDNGPYVTLTELMYDHEYKILPTDNNIKDAVKNSIHFCVRRDQAMIMQVAAFINDGKIINPCKHESDCHRSKIKC